MEQCTKEQLNNNELEKFIPSDEVAKILCMDTLSCHSIRKCLKGIKPRKITINSQYFYHIDDVNNALSTAKIFFENHYSSVEITQIQDIGHFKSVLTKVQIPSGYNMIFSNTRFPNTTYTPGTMAYKKDEINYFATQYQLVSSENADWKCASYDYMPLSAVLEITHFSKKYFIYVVRKSFEIRTLIFFQKTILYHKDDVQELVRRQQEFLLQYTDAKSIEKKFSKKLLYCRHLKNLKHYDVPYYAITKENVSSISRSKGAYKISEVQEYIENLKLNLISTDISGSTSFESFTIRLNERRDWIGFNKDTHYTSKKWFDYVKFLLDASISTGKVLNSLINRYVRCTLLVKDFLDRSNKTELYQLTSNEINLCLRSTKVIVHSHVIYNFLKKTYSDLIASEGAEKIGFKIPRIAKPTKTKSHIDNKSDDIIYDFTVYSDIFKYLLDVDMHVKKSLEEIQARGTAIYCSVWLYAMLHLNNAWRHGDVRDFPKLEIEYLMNDFKIKDIQWFKSKRIELAQARAIIFRIIQWEFIISKTQIKGHFFCSDELAPALATAIIILTLFSNSIAIAPSKYLMKFNTKYNDVSPQMLKKLFENLSTDKFKFSSKRFNKSIMTYITYLANMSGDVKSIEYAKWLRGHERITSTMHYIDYNIEAVEELSKMLFARGEFGYIASLLVTKLNDGITKNFREITEQVYDINQFFGDANKINATVGFLNAIRTDRDSVINYLSTKSLKECQEMLTDLFARNLPSKVSIDVQCLHSKTGCQRNDLSSCYECPFHIPSIYALTTLCDGILHDIREYNKTSNLANKYKLSVRIHRKKLVLSEAIHKFGREYVFGCLGMSKESFMDILQDVPDFLSNISN